MGAFVHAAVIGISSNKAGGYMIVTDEMCRNQKIKPEMMAKMRQFYSVAPDLSNIQGCWTISGEDIVVIYNDGDIRSYNIKTFSAPGKKQKKDDTYY